MYCHGGMGQHRKQKEHICTDLICMSVLCEVCDVIEDKKWVTPMDPRLNPQREITFVKVVYWTID